MVAVGLLLLALGAPALTSAALPDEYVLPGEEVFPEGIDHDPATGYFYVSSTTDGTIFRGHVNDPLTEVFLAPGEDGRATAVGVEADQAGRLFIAGGGSGMVWVYDTTTGALISAIEIPGAGFINDVAVTSDGHAYFTDSMVPIIYHVAPAGQGGFELAGGIELAGTVLVYEAGFNLNGIVATPDDRYLVAVQSNTGELFRITIASGEVAQIDLRGESVTAGDGLALNGRVLYVVRNSFEEVVTIVLSANRLQGFVSGTFTDESFAFPTTAVWTGSRLLVVNSQFNQRGGQPVLPFTVSSVVPTVGGR